MSTWHQDQADRRAYQAGEYGHLAHATRWTLVEDPPGKCRCTSTWRSEEDAEDHRLKVEANHPYKVGHCFIVPPKPKEKA